jgi:hypothetical protein
LAGSSGAGLHRDSFVIWLVLEVALLWTNGYLLQLGQHGATLMPKAFCPAADDDAEEENALNCRRSWLAFASDFLLVISLLFSSVSYALWYI